MRLLKFLAKLRFIAPLASLIILVHSANLVMEGGFEKLVVYDYVLWFTTVLVCLSVYLDVKLIGKSFSYASTILLGILGAVEVALGRLASLILNQALYSPHKLIPLFGSAYTHESFAISLALSSYGSALASIALLIHSIAGKPIVISEGPSIFHVAKTSLSLLARLWEKTCNKLYLLLAFLLGFAFRFLPELIWWPWLIGWDTVEYAAHLMDFSEKLNPFTSYHWMGGMRNIPPLLNILLLPSALAIGAWNTFKLYPSIAYGFLTLSSALVATRVFNLSRSNALFASAVTALFIVNLRISWDYQRQLLGSIFMLLSIAVLDSRGQLSTKRIATSTMLLVCSALSHEVTALFSIAVLALLAFKSIKLRNLMGTAISILALTTSIALEMWYWQRPYTPNVYFGVAPVGVVSYDITTTTEVIGYLMAGFGLILPFAILALLDKSSNTTFSKAGFISLMIAGISPLIAPYTAATTWYRFLAGTAPLASTLAGVWIGKNVKDRRFHAIFILLLLILALPYTYAFEDTARFTSALREFPSGLVPSPANIATLKDLQSLSEWFKKQDVKSTIIAEPEAAKWIHLTIRNPSPSNLVWAWQTPIQTYYVEQILKNLNIDEAYVVCTSNLEGTDTLDVHKLRGGVFKVYNVKLASDERM